MTDSAVLEHPAAVGLPASPRRLLGYMVTRNEADRYLESCLLWANGFLDGIAVYDDQSDDDTAEIAEKHGAFVQVRPDSAPRFLDHEGAFRQRAWRWFEEALEPRENDWCLALDADELLVAPCYMRAMLDDAIRQAEGYGRDSIWVPVQEIFDAQTSTDGALYERAMVRKDGLWSSIGHPRLFAYKPGGLFRNRAMGCGSQPTYVDASRSHRVQGLRIPDVNLLHLGYMVAEDRQAKYERYSSLQNHGHAAAHIQSILGRPLLEPWTGVWPCVWRGTAG